jgi:hypothetical protein
MVNQIPQIGRIAIVQINSTTVGYAQGYTYNPSLSVVKEWVLEPSGTPATGWPQVAGAGQKTASIDIDALYVDNTYLTLFEAMATVTVILGPVGSSGGNTKITCTGYITKTSISVKQSAISTLKISIEVTAAPTVGTW